MAELTVANLFDKALEATSTGIKASGYASAGPWDVLIPRLRAVLGETFDPAKASALSELRAAVRKAGLAKVSEGAFLADGAGLGKSAQGAAMVGAAAVSRCAAVKLLRHTYHHTRRHSHKMWIVSLPEAFSQWPHNYLKCTGQELVVRLGADHERFSPSDRAHLSTATQRGLAWVHKSQVLMDHLGAGSRGLRVLKRWFADADTTDDQLRTFATGTLVPGLKKIATKMSCGSLIVTDFVPIRHSTDAGDKKIAGANAFVWADKHDVVYIEKPFFTHNAISVFQKDERHWARIMVHEMTHREAKTKDNRYGWAGIQPSKAVFNSAAAMNNADSWALFTANAAGAMSNSDIQRSLKGTV